MGFLWLMRCGATPLCTCWAENIKRDFTFPLNQKTEVNRGMLIFTKSLHLIEAPRGPPKGIWKTPIHLRCCEGYYKSQAPNPAEGNTSSSHGVASRHSHSHKHPIVLCKWSRDYINASKFKGISHWKSNFTVSPHSQRLTSCNNKQQETVEAAGASASAYLRLC